MGQHSAPCPPCRGGDGPRCATASTRCNPACSVAITRPNLSLMWAVIRPRDGCQLAKAPALIIALCKPTAHERMLVRAQVEAVALLWYKASEDSHSYSRCNAGVTWLCSAWTKCPALLALAAQLNTLSSSTAAQQRCRHGWTGSTPWSCEPICKQCYR